MHPNITAALAATRTDEIAWRTAHTVGPVDFDRQLTSRTRRLAFGRALRRYFGGGEQAHQ